MIPDSLFSPPQSPVFVLLRVPFSSSRNPCFSLFKVFVSFCSESRCPPSNSSFFLSKSSPILPVLLEVPVSSSPLLLLAAKKTAERHEAVPPFAWWLVVGSKMEHYSSPPPRSLHGTIRTREPLRWRSRLRPRQKWRRPHWCQG